MKILVIDNYDSFTYNLVYILKKSDVELTVLRNDEVKPEAIHDYQGLVLSPGPGIPLESGLLMESLASAKGKIPVLGVCLGHQAIAQHFGANITNIDRVYHGVETPVKIIEPNGALFNGVPLNIKAGRYHSWVVNDMTQTDALKITAVDDSGSVMALEHVDLPIYGLQFHPESILTPYGPKMIQNFLQICKTYTQ